ncbi:MAG: hypothetical protein QOH61_2089 [Chloroflexota bacterium]|nr:hypothetical protein [Chloroflexota bacterium]
MLVVVGLLLLGDRLFPDLVPVVPLALGLALLAAFLVGRSVGALVNGSVTVGVGVGVLVVTGGGSDFGAAGFLVSVAGGFYLCWVLGLIFDVPAVRWWPVVPGSLFLAAGAVVYTAGLGAPLLRFAVDWWPALLVGMGGYLLLHARLRNRAAVDDETSTVPTGVASSVGSSGVAHPIAEAQGGHMGGDQPGSVERT